MKDDKRYLIACNRCGHITSRESSDQIYCPTCEAHVKYMEDHNKSKPPRPKSKPPKYTIEEVVAMARAEGKTYTEMSLELEDRGYRVKPIFRYLKKSKKR